MARPRRSSTQGHILCSTRFHNVAQNQTGIITYGTGSIDSPGYRSKVSECDVDKLSCTHGENPRIFDGTAAGCCGYDTG